MKYLKTYKQILEKKTELLLFSKVFNIIPKSIDYKIIEWMIENWGDVIKKSPYGFSYYNTEKDWDYTVDKSLRLSDHWNFYSADKKHCKIDIPYSNNEYWTIARYDKKTDMYIEEISYPYNYSEENRLKILELKKQYYNQINIDYSQVNKALTMLKTHIKNDNLYVKVLEYNNGVFVKEFFGKVNKLKSNKLIFQDEFGEKQIFNFTTFTKSEMFFYDKNRNLLYHKEKKENLN